MLSRMLADPKVWRERAEECRTVADAIHDATAKAQMMSVADAYELIATQMTRHTLPNDDDMRN